MKPGSPAPTSIVTSLRLLAESLMADVRDRVALFALELEAERYRLIHTLVWIGAAMFAGAMVLAFASLTLVYLFWDTARIAVLSSLTGFYGLMFVLLLIGLRRKEAREQRPFSSTLAEIEEDRRCLHREE